MVVWPHSGELVDVRPYVFVLRVKDMRAIGMDHDPALVSAGMAVASYVITGIEYGNPVASLCQLSRHHGTREPGASNGE